MGAFRAGARAEQGQQDGQQDQAVNRAQDNHQEDHLEKGDEDVRRGQSQADDAENGGNGALRNGQPQGVHGVRDAVLDGHVLVRHEVVGDVGRKVDGKPDAHDQVDHGNAVQSYSPQRHESHDAQLDADDGKGHPERTQGVRNED